ncbi:MAG: ATP-binding protein [Chloroflexota bacterium]
MDESNKKIGRIVGGGLKEGLSVRLTLPAQEVQEGAFVVAETEEWLFYGLVTDLQLGSTNPRFADEDSDERLPLHFSSLLHGQTLFTTAEVLPALMMERGPALDSKEYTQWQKEIAAGLKEGPSVIPIKTIPSHNTVVRMASAGDIAEIFGDTEKKENFTIGYTREQGHPVALNMEKFVKRSSGVFGATGTGKSFLTRLILAGLIDYDAASILVLDMHNEYGLNSTDSDTGQEVIGLKTKFTAKVRIVGLGGGSQIRGNTPDFNLEIKAGDIQPADIEMLTRELNLKETTSTTLEALLTTYGRDNWYQAFRDMKAGAMIENDEGKKTPAPDSVAAWANPNVVNVMAAEGLHNKLRRVFNLSYVVDDPAADGIKEIVKALQGGQHIVLSFGQHERDIDYLLVSNLITRRIKKVWENDTNQFRTTGKDEPRPLVIVVEEAHKLLNREMAAQTTFSNIARELRKYYVTLLIIDQRPSQIYDEVMSQLGTRVSGWLGDDDDIRAVLTGLPGRDALRGMLARLNPTKEVMIMGWGVPMPLPISSRRYDDKFWTELLGKNKGGGKKKSADENIEDLGF